MTWSSHRNALDSKRYASLSKWTTGLAKIQNSIVSKAAQSGPGTGAQGGMGLFGPGSTFDAGGRFGFSDVGGWT